MYVPAIIFEDQKYLTIVDQTLLPQQLKYINLTNLEDTLSAIKQLKVRGAPAIGIVAAYTLYLIADKNKNYSLSKFQNNLNEESEILKNCRPTAINLGWAVNRIRHIYLKSTNSPIEITEQIKAEAIKIHKEDELSCQQIGLNGLEVVPDSCNILTHCNAGSLATGGWGTALGVIYAAHENGKKIHVYVDETRPLGQGGRLTLWELNHAQIPCTLITDSMAASLMAKRKIDLIVFGADRINANGDVANKIGSYSLAVLAKYHNVPCYSAAPISTFDLDIKKGNDIPIELRDKDEVLNIHNYNEKQKSGLNVYNPAFDVTPAELLTGIITERGVFRQPLNQTIYKNCM